MAISRCKAHGLGIVVATATDGSYADGDDTGRIRVAHEIATLNGARVLGIEFRTGAVLPGMEGDLAVYDGDPLKDSRVFFEPRLVISDGTIVLEGAGL